MSGHQSEKQDFSGLDRVGIRALRAQVSGLVQRAAAGERIVITVDGMPTAQLGPLQPSETVSLDHLAAAGLIEPPRRAAEIDQPTPVSLPVDVRLDRLLDEVRGRR